MFHKQANFLFLKAVKSVKITMKMLLCPVRVQPPPASFIPAVGFVCVLHSSISLTLSVFQLSHSESTVLMVHYGVGAFA